MPSTKEWDEKKGQEPIWRFGGTCVVVPSFSRSIPSHTSLLLIRPIPCLRKVGCAEPLVEAGLPHSRRWGGSLFQPNLADVVKASEPVLRRTCRRTNYTNFRNAILLRHRPVQRQVRCVRRNGKPRRSARRFGLENSCSDLGKDVHCQHNGSEHEERSNGSGLFDFDSE